jgi:hypothetical protein
MSWITARVKLISKEPQIRREIQKRIAQDANRRFRKFGGEGLLKMKVQGFLRRALWTSPTVLDMLDPSSYLRASLGLTDMAGNEDSLPDDRVDGIITTLVHGVKVKFRPFSAAGTRIVGGVDVWGVPYYHDDILNLPEALQKNTNVDDGPPYIEYLRWLLEYGAQVVVSGHYVWYDSSQSLTASRTGYAVMKRGGGFSVPAEHQGELGDNFITRAVDTIMHDDIPALLRKVF